MIAEPRDDGLASAGRLGPRDIHVGRELLVVMHGVHQHPILQQGHSVLDRDRHARTLSRVHGFAGASARFGAVLVQRDDGASQSCCEALARDA